MDGKQIIAGFSAIDRKDVRAKVKYWVIYRHREEYPVSVMCRFFGVSLSGYYAFVQRLGRPEPDADLAKAIADCQAHCGRTYGYRRVWLWLKNRNIYRNPKTVLRVMKKYDLLSEIRRRRKWIQMAQQVHKYENLLNRQFQADKPNSKWVTENSIFPAQGSFCAVCLNWGTTPKGGGTCVCRKNTRIYFYVPPEGRDIKV